MYEVRVWRFPVAVVSEHRVSKFRNRFWQCVLMPLDTARVPGVGESKRSQVFQPTQCCICTQQATCHDAAKDPKLGRLNVATSR